MNLLINKCVSHDHWFGGLKQLKTDYKSIVKADFIDTTSSAGDWAGYIMQKTGSTYYCIPVFQANQYPRKGYKTCTGDKVIYVFYTRYVDIEISGIWNILMGCTYPKFPVETLRLMWKLFSDVPINANEDIDTSFLLWKKGTNRMNIWHWFDKRCPKGLVEDIINYEAEDKWHQE